MEMIKKLIIMLCLSAASWSVYAEDISIGEETIIIPPLEGFTTLPDDHMMSRVMKNFVPDTNELLLVKVLEVDLNDDLEGTESRAFEQLMIMQTYKATKNEALGIKEFSFIREYLNTNYKTMFKKLQSKVDSMVDEGAEKFNQEHMTNLALKISDNVPLEVFYNEKERFSGLNVMKSEAFALGNTIKSTDLMSLNVLLVRGKAIFLYLYTPYQSESDKTWIKNLSNDYSQKLLKANK